MENKQRRNITSGSPFCQETSHLRRIIRVQGEEMTLSDFHLLALICLLAAFIDWILWGMK